MVSSSKKELLLILLLFFAPIFIATTLYFKIVNKTLSLSPTSYGYLFSPGEMLEGSYSGRWTLLHVGNEKSPRHKMWQQQLGKMQTMLGPLSDHVSFMEVSARDIPTDFSWNYQLEEGGLLLVDHRGYLALGYSYDQEPRKTFIELKKLVKSTV